MSVSLRYSRNKEEAVEIVNDGFVKIFRKLDLYTMGKPFRGWLRRIMINAAIDHYRQNEKHYHALDISHANLYPVHEEALDLLSAQEIMEAVQRLPVSYRMVFNLHAIEGYKHEEISTMLNISVGTSKSNLSVARSKLKKFLLEDRDGSDTYQIKQDHGR